MLESGLLLQDEIAEIGKDAVLFCHITTQIPGKAHDDLLRVMGGTGFPSFFVLDAEGHKLAVGGEWSNWPPPPSDLTTLLGTGKANLEKLGTLRTAAGKPDAAMSVKAELLLLELSLGYHAYAEARAAADGLKDLDAEVSEKIEGSLVDLEFDSEIAKLTAGGQPAEETVVALGKRFAAWKRVPSGSRAPDFWSVMMQYAESQKDAAMFERGIEGMRKEFGEHPNFQRWVTTMQTKLEAIKAAGKDKSGG